MFAIAVGKVVGEVTCVCVCVMAASESEQFSKLRRWLGRI